MAAKKVTTKQKETKSASVEVEDVKKVPHHEHDSRRILEQIMLPQRVVSQIAEEVANRLKRVPRRRSQSSKKLENPLFLDTSAIIDGRVFELIRIGVFTGTYVAIEGVLDELKHIADSKDEVKKREGKKRAHYA